jgi:hypothetical protein
MTTGIRSRLLLCAVTAALAIGLCAASTEPASASPPRGFFGVVPSALQRPDVTRMAQSGVATVRVFVNWRLVEPQPGQRNWTNYDAVVGVLAESGLQVEPVLFGVPSWISPKPAKPPIYSSAQRQAWTSFLAELAGRYGRGGSFWSAHPDLPPRPFLDWEVWNEPNLQGYWGGRPSPRRFVRLLKLTRAGLDRSDPAARIGIGGIFPPPRPRYGVSLENFMNRLYRVRGARAAFDAVAIHPYASRPKGVLAAVRQARRIMNRHGDRATPMWITELGWTTGGTRWARSPFKATETQQAKFLRQSFRRLIHARRALRLQLLIWHAWQDAAVPGPWTMFSGLIRGDGSAKPALGDYSKIALGR